jgi:transposase
MKGRKWSAEEKVAIVLEGLKGTRSIADICREHMIGQSQYYKWRDRFLEGGRSALNASKGNNNSAYKAEIEKLQRIIGKQTIQIEILKKTQDLFPTK